MNQITSYIDASNVYGSDDVRAAALRQNDGSGKLKTSHGNMLPFNVDGLPNAGGPDPTLFLAGDRDQLVPSVEEGRFMAARVPDATLQILEGYGHICLTNHDLDLLDYVGPWLDGSEARR